MPLSAGAISLCLIAKNEAANLPRLFDSVRGAVDEIVVVDTGSTDDTVSIAQSRGAKVFHVEWKGDFAAAKNEALRRAAGPWIFFLDADMALAEGHAAKIRQAVASGAANAYAINIHSFLADGSTEDVIAHPWLFRRVPGLRFEGAIHETIYPSIIAHGTRREPAPTDITVHHYGYSSEAMVTPRLERNLAALMKELASGRDDVVLHFYLGTTLLGLRRCEEAIAELKQVVGAKEQHLHWRVRANAHLALVRAHAANGDLAAAAQTADEATSLYPHDRMAWVLRGRVALHQSDVNRAAESFARGLAVREPPGGAEASYHTVGDAALEHDLAQAFASAGRLAEAAEHYERALAAGLAAERAQTVRGILAYLYHVQNQNEAALRQASAAAFDEGILETIEMLAAASGAAEGVVEFCRWLIAAGRGTDAARSRVGERPLDPAARADELVAQARRLRRAGMLAHSLAKLQQAVTIAPDRPGLHHELGGLYALIGDATRAAQAYVTELSINPRHVPTLQDMGVLYTQDGNLQEAAAWFELALKVEPTNESARKYLADVRRQQSHPPAGSEPAGGSQPL